MVHLRFGWQALWLSATITKLTPGVYSGVINQTSGPAFNAVPFLPANVVLTPVGTLTVTFANGNSAIVRVLGQRCGAEQANRAAGVPDAGYGVPVNVLGPSPQRETPAAGRRPQASALVVEALRPDVAEQRPLRTGTSQHGVFNQP